MTMTTMMTTILTTTMMTTTMLMATTLMAKTTTTTMKMVTSSSEHYDFHPVHTKVASFRSYSPAVNGYFHIGVVYSPICFTSGSVAVTAWPR